MNLISTYNQILNEGKIDVLKQQYVNKPIKNQKQQNISEEDFNQIVSADPSKNYQYSQWLLNLYFWSQLKLEDLYKATEYLTVFDKFKSKMQEKDINKKTAEGYFYDSLQTLFSVVQPFIEAKSEDNLSDNALNNKIKKEESEKVYEDDEWLIVVPKTKRASCLYGKGTQWCTAADRSDNAFDEYNKRDKLYININKKTGKKYQFHFNTKSFMDENDVSTDILYLENSLLEFYGKLGKLELITILNFSNTELTKIPENIYYLSNLRELNLIGTKISELPESIGKLSKLRELLLKRTRIRKLPESIGMLSNLEILNLSYTPIQILPESIGNLIKLNWLFLSGTQIQALPKSIEKLSNLEVLHLKEVGLSELEIQKLKQILPHVNIVES